MVLTNSLVKFCTFCYKNVLQLDDGGNQQNAERFCKFYKNLNSFVSQRASNKISSGKLVSCRDCEFLIVDFCEVYHQMKDLEVKLQTKLETLMKVMKSAEKVPSRVKALERSFTEIESSNETSNEGKDETNSQRNGNGSCVLSRYQLFRNLRQEILTKCCRSQNLCNLQPRVVLNRINQGEKTTGNKKVEEFRDLTPQISFVRFDFAIGWLWSFGAVLILQSLYSNRPFEVEVENGMDLLDNGSSYKDSLEEPLENEKDQKVVPLPITYHSIDDDSEDNDYEQQSQIEQDENIPINFTRAIENDSTSESSDENPGEILNLKEETKSEVNTNDDVPKSKEKNTKQQKSISWKGSSIKYTREKLKSSKKKQRHSSFKRKSTKPMFPCGLCKTSYTTYFYLRKHKNTAAHRYLERKLVKNIGTVTSDKKRRVFGISKDIPESLKEENWIVKKEDDKVLEDSGTVLPKANLTGYNLRLRKKNTTLSVESDQESEINSDVESDNTNESDSSYTSSSDESGSDEYESKLSSGKIKRESEEKNEHFHKNYQSYRCLLDDCKLKIVRFYTQSRFNCHTKLHSRGEFQCNFCDKIEETPINLSLHETEMHSAIPSSSSNIKYRDHIFYCARCPFQTEKEGLYFFHFGSTHLDICDDKEATKKSLECNNCNRKFVNAKRIENHFKTHHDTSGLENPDLHIKKCDEKECSAYFLSSQQLCIHKNLQHSLKNSSDSLDEFVQYLIEVNDETGFYKCAVCMKESKVFSNIICHIHGSHFLTQITNQTENSSQLKSGKRLICSEINCTKTFKTKKGLEIHKKFHGTFTCVFCDKIENYATDLAEHENELHSIPINSDDQQQNFQKFKCPRCPKIYQFQSNYTRHFVNEHLDISTIHLECSICKFKCHNESLRRHHLRHHYSPGMDPAKLSRCKLCAAYFKTEKQLSRHTETMHKDIIYPFACLIGKCERTFKNKKSLKFHQNLHKRGTYPCKFCDLNFYTLLNLSMHECLDHAKILRSDVKEGLYYCSRCNYENKSAFNYQVHFMETHFGITPKYSSKCNEKLWGKFKCKFCDMEIESAADLGYHEAEHLKSTLNSEDNTSQKFQCSRCPKSYNKIGFIRHFLKVHFDGCTREKRKICHICNVQVTNINQHYKSHHKTEGMEDPPNIYKCEGEDDKCKAYFIKYIQLIQHKRIHHPVLEWKCKECGKKFKTEKSLRIHTRDFHLNVLRNPGLSFLCDVENCKRGFDTKNELEHHKKFGRCKSKSSKILAEETKCDKCGKEFSSSRQLQSHQKTVHCIPSFICAECGKAFRLKCQLQTHSEYHKGPAAWKFQCSNCGKKCATKDHLIVHLRTHSGERPHVCQYCGKKYAQIRDWRNHITSKHKDQDALPEVRKLERINSVCRKGTKRGDCILAGVKQ